MTNTALATSKGLAALKVIKGPWTGPVAAFLLALLLSAWTFDAKLSISGDNAEFITLSRSLASGQGLSYVNLPEPQMATKFPPVFPLMLAPVAAFYQNSLSEGQSLGGPEFATMKWLVVATFAIAAAFLFLLVRDLIDSTHAGVTTVIAVSNALTVSFSHQIMSEVPYMMWSLLALWLLNRGLERPEWRDNHWLWAGVAAMIVAYYTRSAGICLITAVILFLAIQRDWRRMMIVGGVCFAAMLPWAIRNATVGGSIYYKLLFMINPYRPNLGYLTPLGVSRRVMWQLEIYLMEYLPKGVLWVLPKSSYLFEAVALLIAALAILTPILCIRGRRHLLILIYTVIFTGTLALWPWTGTRFIVPLMPLFWFFTVYVIGKGVSWLKARWRPVRVLAVGAVTLILASNTLTLADLARQSANGYLPQWRNYLEAGLWLRIMTPTDAIVTCRKALWMHVVSGRRCVTYAFEEPEAVLADFEAQGVDYAVVDKLGPPQTAEYLVPAISSQQERFQLVFRLQDPDTWVVRFKRDSSE